MSCLRPLLKKDGKLIPCGKCPACVQRHTAGWAFRLQSEERVSTSAHFITFTYDTSNLVTTPNGLQSLCKFHMQNFYKRLRKLHGKGHRTIKHYTVGEYGSTTKRPHYHAIIFNANVDLIELAWSHRENNYQKPTIIGELYYGDVNGHSIGYTLKYICKGKTVPAFKDDDRQREFSLISKGLGISYLTDNIKAWHKADMHNRRYIQIMGGIKVAMPRYYYDKLFDGYEKDLLAMSGSLIQQDEFYKQFMEGYQDRIQASNLYLKRVDASFRRHNIKKLEKLIL